MLRTRDLADHAGLSPPLDQLRELCSSQPDNSNPSPSNNLLTAPSRTLVATVDGWTLPSNTSRPTHSCWSQLTHTLLELELASTKRPRVSVRSRPTRMSAQMLLVLALRLPSKKDQSQSPLRPTRLHSSSITLVSSPRDVDLNLTTVSSLLDTEPSTDKTTSLSRTLGDHHGETKDTSESPQTNVVSPMPLPTQ